MIIRRTSTGATEVVLDGNEHARAITAFMAAHGVDYSGSRTVCLVTATGRAVCGEVVVHVTDRVYDNSDGGLRVIDERHTPGPRHGAGRSIVHPAQSVFGVHRGDGPRLTAGPRRGFTEQKGKDLMGAHIINGEFQSDKYPTTPRGKVPLSVKDPDAQDLLWEYAERRRKVDAEFADDLQFALKAAGFVLHG